MADRVLTLRELNRATLERQMLLERRSMPVAKALTRVAGLQAQAVVPPYVGLWTRIDGFRREQLRSLIERRRVVRATLMRHTLHLATAEDYLVLRPAIQPALTRSFTGIARKRVEGLDLDPILERARKRLNEGPATFAELRALVSKLAPDRDPNVLAYAVRTFLALVQVPVGGRWGYSATAPYALAEDLLGRRVPDTSEPHELILRYLAAFGPGSARDVQAWSGIAGLKDTLEALRPRLRTFRDERGAELFDVPRAPLPPSDAPAPVRFLPDYDNVVLAHADRSRVIADEHRPRVFLNAGRVRATFLVDGFVAGTWKVERAKRAATMVLEPFGRLAKQDREALTSEGKRLIRFQEDDVSKSVVRIARPQQSSQ
jgi:hypothetical protein